MDRGKQVWYDIYVGRLLRGSRPFSVGVNRGTRTPAPLLRRKLLYPAELCSHMAERAELESDTGYRYDPLSRRSPNLSGSRSISGDAYGTRTRVSSLRGWCPNQLDEGTMW